MSTSTLVLALSAPGSRHGTPSAVWDKGRPGCGWGLGPRLSGRRQSRAEHTQPLSLACSTPALTRPGLGLVADAQDVLRPVCQMLPPDRMAAVAWVAAGPLGP